MTADLDLIERAQFRELLGVSSTTFWRLQTAGKLPPPAARLGKKTYWRKTTVSKWLESKQAIR